MLWVLMMDGWMDGWIISCISLLPACDRASVTFCGMCWAALMVCHCSGSAMFCALWGMTLRAACVPLTLQLSVGVTWAACLDIHASVPTGFTAGHAFLCCCNMAAALALTMTAVHGKHQLTVPAEKLVSILPVDMCSLLVCFLITPGIDHMPHLVCTIPIVTFCSPVTASAEDRLPSLCIKALASLG